MSLITFQPSARARPPIPILVEQHAISRLTEIIGESSAYDVVAILHDSAVKQTAQDVASSWKNAVLIEVPSGEQSKSLQEVERLTSVLLDARVTRHSLLIAVGGGMLTDIGGFVASIYMRGIDCVLVPTTFLAMVDAAIGGKTAVDLHTVKNILGTFAHPRAVICDIDALATLPDAALCEGLVEVIKMAAMLDEAAFLWIEKNINAIVGRDAATLITCIEHAVRMKATIVEEDEEEKSNKRMLLNFGHTVGHAIEALSNFQLSHGKAVSIGMAVEMAIAQTDAAKRVLSLLEKIRMPTVFPRTHGKEEVWNAMQSDKKASGGILRIAVPVSIGHGSVQSLTKEKFFQAVT